MKVRIFLDVFCPLCGAVMVRSPSGKTLVCQSSPCPNAGREYKAPTIELEPA